VGWQADRPSHLNRQLRHLASRIAWKMATGRDPIGLIDHRDRNKRNNKIRNLRDVSHGINRQNGPPMLRSNTSGIRGVVPSIV
jgi:HNH endonuclease